MQFFVNAVKMPIVNSSCAVTEMITFIKFNSCSSPIATPGTYLYQQARHHQCTVTDYQLQLAMANSLVMNLRKTTLLTSALLV